MAENWVVCICELDIIKKWKLWGGMVAKVCALPTNSATCSALWQLKITRRIIVFQKGDDFSHVALCCTVLSLTRVCCCHYVCDATTDLCV